MNRRDFLKAAAAAGIVAGLPSAARGATGGTFKTKLEKALIAQVADDVTCERIVKAGFSGVELTKKGVTFKQAIEGRRTAEKHGLRIHSLMSGGADFNNPDPDARKRSLDVMTERIQVAAASGASTMLLVPCRVNGQMPAPTQFSIDFDPQTLHVRTVVKGGNAPFSAYIDAQNRSTNLTRVGIIGFGFMGRMHHRCWRALPDVRIAALCDPDAAALQSGGGPRGNIAGASEAVDLSGVALYTDPAELFARERLDAVSITVPTHLHADVSVRALEAGAHVLCEKPMALSCAEGRRMLDAAVRAGRHLQIGHCIRFWPEYVKAREIVTDGTYGRVISAAFRRFSATARTRRGCWFEDAARSGGMLFDLHSHDTDFVQHLFGLPESVSSHGDHASVGANHILTAYRYAGGPLVTAEGGWAMTPSHGFQMVFTLVMEGAVVCFDSKKTPTLTVYPESGEPFSPPIAAGDGYEHQIRHFIGLIRGDRMPAVISPHNALTTLRLLEAERESMAEGQAIEIKEEIIGRKCQQETTVCGWPLSVCSWSLRCDPDGVARALSELDIRLVNLALKPVFAENGAEYLAAVRRLAWPLSAATIGFFHEDYTSLESIRTTGGIVPDAHWPRSREMVLRAIDLTVELGAPFLTLHAGFIEEEDGTAAQRVRDRLTLLADAAGEHGIGLLLETGQESAGSLRHLLETLRHPALGINFDPANMILYGKGNPVQAIGTLAPWIRHIHVKDALTARQPGQWGTEVPWGDGEVGQQDFLQALHKVGYRGALAIEREAGDDRQRDIGIAIKRLRRE